MSTPTKLALGAAMAIAGSLGMTLWQLLGWPAVAGPWGSLLAFLVGVVAGAGAALTIAGFVERRRGT